MFEINRQPLTTEIRCSKCRASLEVNSDSKRLTMRKVIDFQLKHLCRNTNEEKP